MQRTERDRLEDEHLECALREFNRFRQRLSPLWERRVRDLSFPVKETGIERLRIRLGDCQARAYDHKASLGGGLRQAEIAGDKLLSSRSLLTPNHRRCELQAVSTA
jgi:hypothetical protein